MKKLVFLGVVVALLLAIVPLGSAGAATPPELVGWWHFDGNADDSSGNGNNGTVYGGATYVPGKFGQVLSFDGVDDYVDCGNDASLRPTNTITVEAWVNYAQFFADSGGHAAICEGYYYDGTGFMLYQATGSPYNRVRYYVTTTDAGNPIGQSPTLLSTDTWYHLAMVYDGSHVKLYIDGFYDSSVATTESISWAGTIRNLYIGSTYTAGGAKFKGFIDEVLIWNRALSADEIALQATTSVDFLPPITNDEFALKDGTALPIHFQLRDGSGSPITEDLSGVINVRVDTVDGDGNVLTNVANLTPVFDSGTYNAVLQTKGLGVGTGQIRVTVEVLGSPVGDKTVTVDTAAGTARGNSGKP